MSDQELAARVEEVRAWRKRPELAPPTQEELDLEEETWQYWAKKDKTDEDRARHVMRRKLELYLYMERVYAYLGVPRARSTNNADD